MGSDETSGREQSASKYQLTELAYDQTRVSPLNPRYGYEPSDESLASLVLELKAVGQAHDAVATSGSDGVAEILSGSRRRAAFRIMGRPLRVRVYEKLSLIEALKIANRVDRGSLEVSFWDKSAAWKRTLAEKANPGEAKLADAVGEDASVISRGLALQRAPVEILDLYDDRRAISQTQWFLLAPMLEDPVTRERVLERAALLAGTRLSVPAVTKQLLAAAAGKQEIKPHEVFNRHGKVVATIVPDHRGGFTIKVKSMTEAHPTYRIDHAKLIHDAFVQVQKDWFGKDG